MSASLLRPGDPFPPLQIDVAEDSSLSLPGDLADEWSVVLFYRGSWCPYCQAQLRAFQRALPRLTDHDIRVVALSIDDRATTQQFVDDLGLTFPVGHSADAEKIAAATGAFVDPDSHHLQSTGFVLDRDGRVVVSVYSSGAIGRLLPEDVLGLVTYARDHAAA